MSLEGPNPSPPNPLLDIPEDVHQQESGERTPKEWREELRGLITSAQEKLGMSERGEHLKAYLSERSGSLQEEAKNEYGPRGAGALGSVIERYNKLNWKTKLAVTGTLMLGVSATVTALPLVSGALTVALYGQRLVGAVGLGINKRKALDARIAANPEHWMAGKSKLAKNAYAAALATVYMAGTSFVVHEGVEFLRSLGAGEWFSGAPDTQPRHIEAPAQHIETPSAEPEVQQPETVPPVETPASAAPAPEDVSVSPDTEPTGSLEVANADMESANLAVKEFGAEYAKPEAAPEDLSAQEWRAEYAEPVNHTGAPEWRAEHTESDFAPETSAETSLSADVAPPAQVAEEEVVTAPDAVPADTSPDTTAPADAPPAPLQPEAGVAPAPETSHLVVNAHGLSIDETHAGAYLDTQGNHIIYGGSLDDRAEIAKQLVAKDRSAIVFFDSTRTEKFLGLFERKVPHLSMAHWVEAGGDSGVRIAEDTNDPSLVGMMLPTADDLAQVYKPN